MSIRTIADLFAAGFDADIALNLEGLDRGTTDVESLASRTLGSEWQGAGDTLRKFERTVRVGLEAGRIASEGLSGPVTPQPPSVEELPGSGQYRISGVLRQSSPSSDTGETPELEVPFSIDTDLFLTPFELLEILENSEIDSVRSMLDGSPDLRKRLEELEYERIAPNPGDWQVDITSIIERINEKGLS